MAVDEALKEPAPRGQGNMNTVPSRHSLGGDDERNKSDHTSNTFSPMEFTGGVKGKRKCLFMKCGNGKGLAQT